MCGEETSAALSREGYQRTSDQVKIRGIALKIKTWHKTVWKPFEQDLLEVIDKLSKKTKGPLCTSIIVEEFMKLILLEGHTSQP